MSITPVGSGSAVPLDPSAGSVPAATPDASAAGSSAATVARGSGPQNPLSAAALAPPPDERYEPDLPMAAYDHLATVLVTAGGRDGVISRDEAAGLVAGLRKDGLGTEALAAEQLFAMIDEYDDARGARVTAYDFDRARPLAEMWLKSGDGAKSPLGLALAELGRTLGFPPVFEHLAKQIPERGLQHLGALIAGAAGADGVVSRADARALVDTLKAQGRGTEAHGVDMFFRFMEHRSGAPGARITASDIDETIRYARTHLLENKDLNRDGYYQPNERDLFSTTAKAFLHTGRLAMFGGARPTLDGPDPQPRPSGVAQFDENRPLPDGFTVDRSVTDGSFQVDGQGKVTLTGIDGADLKETRLLETAFGAIWERSTQHRVWPAGAAASVADNGSMDFGTWDDPDTGTTYHVAKWNDIDDDSHVFYFTEAPGSTASDPQFSLAWNVYLN